MSDALSRSLAGQVAVVTGGSRGLGCEIAVGLGRAGAHVVVAARPRSGPDDVLRAPVEREGDPVHLDCDVLDEGSVRDMADDVLARFGRVDVVVANAGIAGPTRPMHEISLSEWRECVATDLDGVFLTFRAFIPAMIAAGCGKLLAISSMTGKRPLAGRTPYAAAKMGVIGLVRTLAVELGPHGITVNSLCPGAIEGARIDQVIELQAQQLRISAAEARRQFTAPAALQRLVDPAEVAAACVFLASPAASGITGEDLNVSAGLVMY